MKRTLITMMMLVVVMMAANAQRIASMGMEDGHSVIYLENGVKLDGRAIPNSNRLRVGETIEMGSYRIAADDYYREAIKYQVPVTGMYGVGMVGMYGGIGLGATGSSFSIGNGHWSVGTSTTNYGGYKTKTTGIKIGSFHIGTSSAKYEQPTAATPSYTAQKKADAKKAATRYSQMRSAGVTNNGQTSTKATTTTNDTTTAMWNY